MVILTGKALRTDDQQMYVFFVLFFVFGRKRVAFFVFVSVLAEKRNGFFGCFYFSAENGKFIFGRPLVWNSLPESHRDLALTHNSFRQSLKTNLFRCYQSTTRHTQRSRDAS